MTETPAATSDPTGWRRLLRPLGALLGLLAVAYGLVFLADQKAAPNLVANLYDLLGNSTAAVEMRSGSGDRTVAKLLITVVAIAVGVGGVWLMYYVLNALVERLGTRWYRRLLPWVFVGPALVMVTIFLIYPAIATALLSITESGGVFKNYGFALTDSSMFSVFRNNLIWLVVGTLGSVGLGLLIAGLVDRVQHESVAKTFIFLPLAISLVGASVIWAFVYTWRPPGQPQYGLLNAIWTALGQKPVAWVQTPGINTFALIVILIWLETGFAMVILSAAIKGVPTEITEAAKLDGAPRSVSCS